MKIDYVGIYKSFLNLQDSINDLDVLEEMSANLDAFEELGTLSDFNKFGLAVDDTTMVYMERLIHYSSQVVTLFTPLCDDFLGISKEARKEAMNLLPKFLVSYGIILYKSYGYDAIAEYYAVHNNIDPSKLDLNEVLLDEVATDLTGVIDTLRTILVVFKTFGAYFAEYQIADSEDLNDVIANLEDRGFGTEAISSLSKEEVERILNPKEQAL